MATSSIGKKFVVKDDAAFDILLKVMQQKPRHPKPTRDYYEEGKKALEEYYKNRG